MLGPVDVNRHLGKFVCSSIRWVNFICVGTRRIGKTGIIMMKLFATKCRHIQKHTKDQSYWKTDRNCCTS